DPEGNGPAAQTIARLNLRDSYLVAHRKAAIEALLFDDTAPLSLAQLKRLQGGIMRKDNHGKYMEFCFVLKQACAELTRKAKREHARREAIHRQQALKKSK
ncbi:MAG: hypothetical protein ACLQVD_12385, partial [Capsulimonadaceae bacterium]